MLCHIICYYVCYVIHKIKPLVRKKLQKKAKTKKDCCHHGMECIHSGSDTNRTWPRVHSSSPWAVALRGSDAGSDGVEPASGFVTKNRQITCPM